jgi:prephenate dehydrogenase
VLATPVGIMADLVRRLLDIPLAPGTLMTDLGSVKGSVVSAIDALLAKRDDLHFVGSHPMAGKERAGIEHACTDLFQGAACVITPGASSNPTAIGAVEKFWQQLGCRTTHMQPAQHDEAVARVSHLPHLAASLIARNALGGDPSAGAIAGAGLRDTTRVASGSPEMWAEILLENRTAIAPALRELVEQASEALALLESAEHGPLESLLRRSKQLRDGLPEASPANDGD